MLLARSCLAGEGGVWITSIPNPMPNLNEELSIGVSIVGGSVNVLDWGAVTADLGVDIEESLADRGAWRYGLEMVGRPEEGEDVTLPPETGEERDDVDFFENSRCRDGFLSRFARAESESGLETGEKLGRESTGIDRRFSSVNGGKGVCIESEAEDGN